MGHPDTLSPPAAAEQSTPEPNTLRRTKANTLAVTLPGWGDYLLLDMEPLGMLSDGRRVMVCDVHFPDGTPLCPAVMIYDTADQTFAPEVHFLGDDRDIMFP